MTHDQECQNLNFPGHNCGQELKYSCSCKVGLRVGGIMGEGGFDENKLHQSEIT